MLSIYGKSSNNGAMSLCIKAVIFASGKDILRLLMAGVERKVSPSAVEDITRKRFGLKFNSSIFFSCPGCFLICLFM
jgi:hypothetical protein